MLNGLATSSMVPPVVNRHQKDRLLIVCRTPQQTPLVVQGANGQSGNLVSLVTSANAPVFTADARGNFFFYNPALSAPLRYLKIQFSGTQAQIISQSNLWISGTGGGSVATNQLTATVFGVAANATDGNANACLLTAGSFTRTQYAGAGNATTDVYFLTSDGLNGSGRVNANQFQIKTGSGASSSTMNAGNGGNFVVDLGTGGVGTGFTTGVNGQMIVRRSTDSGVPAGNTTAVLLVNGPSILTAQSATEVPLVLKLAATPSGDAIQIQPSGSTTPLVKINSVGVIFPLQAPTASAPAYVAGGMYYDTTLNKLRIGGAIGWETVTSS